MGAWRVSFESSWHDQPRNQPPTTTVDDKQLAKLVRQNAAKAEKLAKARQSRRYDKTLPPPSSDEDADLEREQFFKEMRRREF